MSQRVYIWRVWRVLALVIITAITGVAAAPAHARFGSVSVGFAIAQSPQAPSPPSASAEAVVVMKGVKFQPAELSVRAGQTVEFRNEDIFAHTVTADDGSFDSGLIQPGSTWKMTMPKTGSVTYHCRPHPNMRAKLVAAAAPDSDHAAHGFPGFNPPRRPEELHPILVNFTAALLPLALLSDVLGRLLKRASLHNTAAWMVLYAALITPLTALAGWWWKSKSAGALPPSVIAMHQWLGTSLAIAFVILATWRWRIHKRDAAPGIEYLCFAAVVVLALVYQGSLGGLMVFGK